MQEQPPSEPGKTSRRRVNKRSVVALVSIIAVASAIGIVISLGQRPASAPVSSSPTPSAARQAITPTPIPLVPAAGIGFSVADDLASHEVVLFGGVGDYPNTWVWDGASWTLAHPSLSPAGRFGASEAYDPQTKTVMLFGGRLEPGEPVHDTWAWNGTTWVQLDSGAGGPDPGEGSDMAWDPATMQMVLLTRSGVISNPAATWVWAGTHWRHSAGGALPAGATYSPMGYDPVTRSLIAVGCCVGPPPSTGAVNTTWRWNGNSWTLLPPTTGAPLNGSTMALDPMIGRLVLCDCSGSSSTQAALWVWGGTDWASFPTSALPVTGGTEVTDGTDLLIFGPPKSEAKSQAPPVDAWVLTSRSTWSQVGKVS